MSKQQPGSERTENPELKTENYQDQVRTRNGRWQVACVECAANQTGPAWRNVAIRAWAYWIFHQVPNGGRNKTIEGNWQDPEYLCGVCGADVGYMLSEKIKSQLKEGYVHG